MKFPSLYRILCDFGRPWRWLILPGIVLLAVSGFVNVKAMDLTIPVFESLMGANSVFAKFGAGEPAAINGAWHDLWLRTGRLFLTSLGAAVGMALTMYAGEWISQRLLMALRGMVFDHLQSLSLSFFERKRSGELVSRINNDTMVLQKTIGPNIGRMGSAPFVVVFGLARMLTISHTLTLVMAAMVPLIIIATNWLGGKVRRYGRTVQEKMADLTAVISETFQAIRVIKVFGMERMIEDRFGAENLGVLKNEMRATRVGAFNVVFVGALTSGAICATMLLGAHEIVRGHATAAQLLGFLVIMQLVASQINVVSRTSMSLQLAEAAATRLLQVLSEPQDIAEAKNPVTMGKVQGAISLRDVTFAYDKEPVLHNVSLEFAPGEVVALAGPSGSGKTTIANLVARLYDVNEGAVCIDGVDVRQLATESLHGHMGIVPQESVLFGASVRENIGYGRLGASQEDIVAAAEAANAHGFITGLPEGYDTQVGERGAKLSGGQKQRVAIARALLRDPAILILDEATSSLDAESEAAVHRALQALVKGRTAIIIAHRLSTIQNADRIVVLERGRVVEQGTHEELMAREGLYRRLYETRDLLGSDGGAEDDGGDPSHPPSSEEA